MSVQRIEQQPLSQYSAELMHERQQIIGRISAERAFSDRPLVEGITYDRKGTFSCEQGLSIHHEDGETVLGYHVVDASLIPEAGSFETYGYGQQTDVGSSKIIRLFGDRILYNHLNLANPHGDGKPIPSISFFFVADEDAIELSHVQKTLFVNTAALTHDDISVDDQHPAAQQIVDVVSDYTPVKNLVDAEHRLSQKAADVSEQMLAKFGIPLFRDDRNRKSVNRPMRVWADFKNLQMLSMVMDGELPLYTSLQMRNMQQRARGKTKRYDTADITPSTAAELFVSILNSPDLTKRVLHFEDFAALVDYFDPETPERSNDPLLTNIFEWARSQGLFALAETGGSQYSLPLKFHNLDKPFELRFTPESSIHEIAYSGLVTYLQNCPREHKISHIKAKRLLSGIQKAAAEQAAFSEDEELRRFVQRSVSQLMVRKQPLPRRNYRR